ADLQSLARVNAAWLLGCLHSNLGMPVPKTGALPLGDAPTRSSSHCKRSEVTPREARRKPQHVKPDYSTSLDLKQPKVF
ncbi:hypothetical protein, partial [Shinella sp.]|uniref:hypothetical protein n=1 Tax=Shinella sp. TaxID=1870904 RepID=UPI0028A147F8